MQGTAQPIFQQIIDSVRAGIANGLYARGAAIPSEPELCRRFHTTRITVRHALDTLVAEGQLYRVRGKGTFVSHFELQKTYQMHGFTQNMLALGVRPSSRVLVAEERAPDRNIRESLELEPDEAVFYLERLRLADLEPIAIERVHLSSKRFSRLLSYDFNETSLYDALRGEYALEAGYSRQKLNAVQVTGADAKLLFGKNSGVALHMRNIDYDKNCRPIIAADSLYHGAKYTFDVMIK